MDLQSSKRGKCKFYTDEIDNLKQSQDFRQKIHRHIMIVTGILRLSFRRFKRIFHRDREQLFNSKFDSITPSEIANILETTFGKRIKNSCELEEIPYFKNVIKLKLSTR